jgi:predicted nucleic acid-binding protein
VLAPEFVDSNVLVCAYDSSDARKQATAWEPVRRAGGGEIVGPAQVLGEFAETLLPKFSPPASADDVLAILFALGPIRLVATDSETVRRAVQARATCEIHFCDGMTVGAAEGGSCKRIWAENLDSGQKHFDIEVPNPFA